MTTHTRVVTIEQTAKAMAELARGTDPSLLHALRAAALSPRMNLKCNAGYATALCPWRNDPLPWRREELIDILDSAVRGDGSGKPAWGLMQSHINTLYSIDEFWFSERWCDLVYEIGDTLAEQRLWRCRVNSLIRGMGFKCLSWALFIYAPETCKLLTLDSHHAKRLQVDPSTIMRDTLSSHVLYEQLEDKVIAEVNELYPGYPSTVGAACLWYNVRNSGPESHAGLNCRV